MLNNKRLPNNKNSRHVVTAPLVTGVLFVVEAGWSVILAEAAVLAVGCTAKIARFFLLPVNVTSISTEKSYCKPESVGTEKKSAVKSMLKAAVFVPEDTPEMMLSPPELGPAVLVYKLVGVPWSLTEMLNNSVVATSACAEDAVTKKYPVWAMRKAALVVVCASS